MKLVLNSVLLACMFGQATEPLPPGVVGRMGTTRYRFSTIVFGQRFQYTKDGSALVAIDPFRQTTRIDLKTGTVRQFGDSHTVYGIMPRLSPDGEFGYAITNKDHQDFFLETVSTKTGKRESLPLKLPDNQRAMDVIPDGPRLFVMIHPEKPGDPVGWGIYDVRTKQLKSGNASIPFFRKLEFSRDFRFAVLVEAPMFGDSELRSTKVYILDTHEVKLVKQCEIPLTVKLAHRNYEGRGGRGFGYSTEAAFDSTGSRLILAVTTLPYLIWDWKKDALPKTLFEGNLSRLCSLAVSPNDKWLYLNHGSDAYIYDFETRKVHIRTEHQPYQATFSPDGKKLSGLSGALLISLDVDSGKIVQPSADPPFVTVNRFGREGSTVITDDAEYDWRSAKLVRKFRPEKHARELLPDTLEVLYECEAFSPDKKHAVYVKDDGKCRGYFLDPASPLSPNRQLPVVGDEKLHVSFVRNGQEVFTIKDWTKAQRWRFGDLSPIADLEFGEGFHDVLANSTNGNLTLIGSGSQKQQPERIRLIDFESGKISKPIDLPQFHIGNNEISPDEQRAFIRVLDQEADQARSFLGVLDRRLGRWLVTHPWHQNGHIDAIAPNGRCFMAGNSCFETITGQVRWKTAHKLEGNSHAVFSANSRYMSVNSDLMPMDVYDVYCQESRSVEPVWNDAERDKLWLALEHGDAAKAFDTIARLIRNPEQAVNLIRNRLKPAAKLDGKLVDRWLADLSSGDFEVRESATKNLKNVVHRFERRLHRDLENFRELEVNRRIEAILATATRLPTDGILQWRALEVLEVIGPKRASSAIQDLLNGDPDAPLTHEARLVALRWRNAESGS